MGDIFKHILDFIFNKTRKNPQRIFLLFLLILLVLTVNDYYGITKNWMLNRKLNQLEKLRNITPSSFDEDSVIRLEIAQVKRSMFDKSTFTQKAGWYIRDEVPKMITWRGFSASFIILLVALLYPITELRRKNTSVIMKIGELIFVLAMCFIWTFGLIKLQSVFPTYRPIIINHIINFFLQMTIIVVFGKLVENKKEKEHKETEAFTAAKERLAYIDQLVKDSRARSGR